MRDVGSLVRWMLETGQNEKIMFRKLITFIALVTVAFGAGAQEMNLNDCMRYAVSNSTKVRIQQAAVDDAQLARRDAILRAFSPYVSGSTSAYYNFGRSIDPQTNTYFNQTSFHNNYNIGAGITIFNGFEAVNNLRITKTSLALGRSQEKQIEADICLAVMEAYYNVLYYNEIVEIFTAQVETGKSAVAKAEKQEEIGQKGHADVVQMRAELAGYEYDLINAKNQYNAQLLNLKDLMFWPMDDELVIDTSVADRETIDLADPNEVENVSEYASKFNPSVMIAGGKLFNAKKELRTAKWQLLPSLELYGGWSTSYFSYIGQPATPFGNQFRNNSGEYLQLSMNIPIFNRLSGQSKIRKQRNAVKVAQAEYDQTLREVENEVRKAVQDRDGAGAAFMQAQRMSEVHEEAYWLNTKKMEQGLVSPIEFQTATNNYLKAKAERLNSLCLYLIKQSVVRYYAGEEYINQ